MPGRISRPRVAWSHAIGGPIFDASTIAGDHAVDLLLLWGGCIHRVSVDGTTLWKSDPQAFEAIAFVGDLDGDGRIELVASNGKSLFILDSDSGRILWTEYLGAPYAAGMMPTGILVHHFPGIGPGMQIVVGMLSSREVLLFDCSRGAAATERRHVFWMDDFFHPSVLAFDVDGDGSDELIVTKYSAIYSFDPVTGREKARCRWTSGGTPKRNYGLFQVVPRGGDRLPGLIMVSERVSRHIAYVTTNSDGTFDVAWDRFIEHIYPHDVRDLRCVVNSVVDCNRDDRLELVVSEFNVGDDERWWLEVRDLETGVALVRQPDLFLLGIIADFDGSTLIVARRQRERVADGLATIVGLTIHNARLRTEFELDSRATIGRFRSTGSKSTWFRSDIPPGDDIWSVEIGGRLGIPLLGRDGALTVLSQRDESWRELPTPHSDVAAILCAEDLDGDGRTNVVLSTRGGEVLIADEFEEVRARIRVGLRMRYGTGAYYRAKPAAVPVVYREDGNVRCVVPDTGGRLHVLDCRAPGEVPAELAVIAGRGACGPEESWESALIARADSRPVVLSSGLEPGTARVEARTTNGTNSGSWTIPGIPASRRTSSDRLGPYEFSLVASDEGSMLVVSSFQAASMNAEVTIGIDPSTGDVRWMGREVGADEDGRGFGPWNACSSVDSTIAFLAKDTVCVVDAMSGRQLIPPWQLRSYNTVSLARNGMSMDDFAAYGSLVAVDIDGEQCWLVAAAYGGIGLIDGDLQSMRWWHPAPLSSLSGAYPGVGDVDSNGRIEIGIGWSDGIFSCLDAASGEERWRLPLGTVVAGCITCDIDGDGRDEFIVTTQQGAVLAIGTASTGVGMVKWRLDLRYSLSEPIAADVDGDGFSEVVVVSGDGAVVAITAG